MKLWLQVKLLIHDLFQAPTMMEQCYLTSLAEEKDNKRKRIVEKIELRTYQIITRKKGSTEFIAISHPRYNSEISPLIVDAPDCLFFGENREHAMQIVQYLNDHNPDLEFAMMLEESLNWNP